MNTNDAADALQDFADGAAIDAAEDMAKAFELAGDRISSALDRAAKSGEFSFSNLAQSITRDLAGLAITELFTNPLQQAIGAPTILKNPKAKFPRSLPVLSPMGSALHKKYRDKK